MNANVFLDTNILVYAHTDVDPVKQAVAQNLVASNNNAVVSSQVLQELANTLNRKFKHLWENVQTVLINVKTNSTLHINTEKTILDACRIAKQYGFSFYDSLIIAAAIECNCDTLFSEDMNNGQIIDKKLKIVNPFSV